MDEWEWIADHDFGVPAWIVLLGRWARAYPPTGYIYAGAYTPPLAYRM